MGEHWSPVAEIQPNHTLVTTSLYRFIRHPIYASIFLSAIGQFMLIGNWIVGPSALYQPQESLTDMCPISHTD